MRFIRENVGDYELIRIRRLHDTIVTRRGNKFRGGVACRLGKLGSNGGKWRVTAGILNIVDRAC